VSWLIVAGWAMFVIGGLAAGHRALHTFGTLEQHGPPKSGPVAAIATPPPPLAAHPTLRDLDQSPPPLRSRRCHRPTDDGRAAATATAAELAWRPVDDPADGHRSATR
jgi:hypothetical protein